jgi:hypothetical protein
MTALLISVLSRCPTTTDLGLVFYSTSRLTWGFHFNVPKFDGHSELYVACDAMTCDTNDTDSKRHCDRSCNVDHRRAPRHGLLPGLGALRGGDVQGGNGEVLKQGPFMVADKGVGPLITSEGLLVFVRATDGAAYNGEYCYRFRVIYHIPSQNCLGR